MTDEVNMASPLVRDVKSEILEDIIKIRLKTCILSQEFEQKNKKKKTFYYDDINQKTGINTGGTIS